MVTIDDIRQAARKFDLCNRPLCIHVSLRSFGGVEGGPATVIDGLLAEGCTVMVPTFSMAYLVRPPENPYLRNADGYAMGSATNKMVYAPDSTVIDGGAVASTIVAMPGRVRGDHPICSFTAVGPVAWNLVARQGTKFRQVFIPLHELTQQDGAVVLMGVRLDKMTYLHAVEEMARRRLFRRWANGPDGRLIEIEIGGCSRGFEVFWPYLAPFKVERKVGKSLWIVYSGLKAMLRAAKDVLLEKPGLTHCGSSLCVRCDDAVSGGPVLEGRE